MSDILIGAILAGGSAFYAVSFGLLAIETIRGRAAKKTSKSAIWFQLTMWIIGLLLGIGAIFKGIQQIISN